VWGADHLTGHDAATGKLIWSYGGFNPEKRAAWRTIASPAHYQGIIVVPYGRGRYTSAMRTGVSGDKTEKDFLWQKTDIGADVATPLVSNGRVYLLSFNGILNCLDVATGEELWRTNYRISKEFSTVHPHLPAINYTSAVMKDHSMFARSHPQESRSLIRQVRRQFCCHTRASPGQDTITGTKNLYCIGK
jgi:hypothetical protein